LQAVSIGPTQIRLTWTVFDSDHDEYSSCSPCKSRIGTVNGCGTSSSTVTRGIRVSRT
jgi:hypothetical protein